MTLKFKSVFSIGFFLGISGTEMGYLNGVWGISGYVSWFGFGMRAWAEGIVGGEICFLDGWWVGLAFFFDWLLGCLFSGKEQGRGGDAVGKKQWEEDAFYFVTDTYFLNCLTISLCEYLFSFFLGILRSCGSNLIYVPPTPLPKCADGFVARNTLNGCWLSCLGKRQRGKKCPKGKKMR